MSEMFDPVLYSINENRFLLTALGKPPVVALRDLPSNVNVKAVEPLLRRVYELEQLKEHEGLKWAGVDAVKEKIIAYLRENEKWKSDHKRFRRAPRFPSMFSFDSKGRAHRGGVGSDSDRVRTYFDEQGNRIPFEIPLSGEVYEEWTAPGAAQGGTEGAPSGKLKVDSANNRIECTLCGHTESFKGESRSSYNAARARISKHLRKATTLVDEHRELHTEEFA